MVADDLLPSWHQFISNIHDDIGQSVSTNASTKSTEERPVGKYYFDNPSNGTILEFKTIQIKSNHFCQFEVQNIFYVVPIQLLYSLQYQLTVL